MDDLISRQAAIEAIKTWGLVDGLSEGQAIEILADKEKLPSAQPEVLAHGEGELSAQPDENKYEYHYDHTDCIWYRPEARNRCPATCAQYRDGRNDAMNYIFRDGEGYRPFRRDKKYEG